MWHSPLTSLDVMWHSRHSSLTSLDVITPLCVSRTIQYLHRCLKTKDPLCHLGNEWRHTFQTFQTFHRGRKLLSYRRFPSTDVLKTTYDLKVTGRRGRGRPKMSWPQLLKNDCSSWGLSRSDPKDRNTWRWDVKSAMRAASQSSGREVPSNGGSSLSARKSKRTGGR